MDFATKFALNLKQYFDIVPTNVWYDFERNLLPSRTWDEDSILRTSILYDGLDNNAYLLEANRNPVYKLKVKSEDYGGNQNETITGADLALILSLEVNKVVVARRLVLVQLKRAFFDNTRTKFPALHHRSGKKYYGQDFHQAQKMLFFSTTPVYWFATTSAIMEDEPSMTAYSQESNLLRSSKTLTQTMAALEDNQSSYLGGLNPILNPLAISDFSAMSPSEIEEYFEDLYHYFPPFYRFLRHYSRKLKGNNLTRYVEYVKTNIPYQFWQLLKNRLESIAFDNYGLPQRIGLFVCSAEDIYTLSHQGLRGFSDLYPRSIPFSQFILQNILCREFGDSNAKLIDAVINRDVAGYFRNRVQEIANRYDFQVPDEIEDLPPVYRSILITLSTNLVPENEG